MSETVIVVIIVALAVTFGAYTIYRSFKAQGGCNCGMNKTSKPPPCCQDNRQDK